jgi:galactitol-specific phosphotransferase system IIB component
MRLPRQRLRNICWENRFVRRKRNVICVSGIGTSILRSKPAKMNVQYVADQVGNYGRAGAALGKLMVVASNLRQYCRHFGMQHEVGVFYEITADATKVDCAEEVLEINIENISLLLMSDSVRDDSVFGLKSMRKLILELAGLINLFDASEQQIGKVTL